MHIVSFQGFEEVPILDYFTTCATENVGGGIIGGLLALGLVKAVGRAGAIVIVILAILVCLLIVFELPIIEGIKLLFSKTKKDDDDEEDEEPDKVVVPRKKARALTRRREETVYETQSDEGITIRIVQSKKRQRPTPTLKRVGNKAAPLRDGSHKAIEGQKSKGVANVGLIPHIASGDEVHEITNARPTRRNQEVEIPKPIIQVTDVEPLEDDGLDPITMRRGVSRADGLSGNKTEPEVRTNPVKESPVKEAPVKKPSKKPEQKITNERAIQSIRNI